MSKVKSAIITAVVCLAVLALAFFAVVSFNYGSSGKRLNSVLSSISLGSEFTGDAETVIYPEGVITYAQYVLYLPEDTTSDDYTDYVDQYRQIPDSELYYDTDEISESELADIKTQVKADAAVINSRLNKMGYSTYSVSVYDDYGIKISVATGYSYADYVHSDYLNDENSSSEKLSAISTVLSVLTLDGPLTLRNADGSSDYDKYDTGVNSLVNRTVDLTEYFSKVSAYISGGNYAVKVKLSSDGLEAFTSISNTIIDNEYDSQTIDFYVGGDELLSLTIEETIEDKTFYISVSDEASANSYASVLSSVANGETVELEYSSELTDSITVTAGYVASGRYKAIAVAAATLVLFIAAVVISVMRYKKLGLVSSLSLLIYLLAAIYAVFLMEIELSLGGIVVILLGGALLTLSSFHAFENVRYFVKHGNVMANAVKQGYKRSLAPVLDVHIVVAVAAFIVALAADGALASFGLLFLLATIASYALYWFTRFMWYVESSPQKDKFAFCGFKREVIDDD